MVGILVKHKILLSLFLVFTLLVLNSSQTSYGRSRKSRHNHDHHRSHHSGKSQGLKGEQHEQLNEEVSSENATDQSKEVDPGLELKTTTEIMETLAKTTKRTLTTEITKESQKTTKSSEEWNTVVVETKNGKLKGKLLNVSSKKGESEQISAFLGVRFAEAPLGNMRYKKPVKAKKWSGVEDATQFKPNCYQIVDTYFDVKYGDNFKGTKMWNSNTGLSEDCLFLNIWTPATDLSINRLLPVMVWIYGGGFYSGSATLDVYNGQWLSATQNVVVVSINYRVAALGFLAYDEEHVTGNAGLYDQRLALEWVQENIDKFGGDRSQVTLFGESAGGASVSYHLHSDKSQDLFKNAIAQSGSLLSPWAMLSVEEAHRRSKILAERLNCTDRYPPSNMTDERSKKEATIECFQKMDAKTIVETDIYIVNGTFRFPNAPIPSNDFIGVDPKKTLPLDSQSDKNLLLGYNANEGNYFIIYTDVWYGLMKNECKINHTQFLQGIDGAILNPVGDNASELLKNNTKEFSEFLYTQGRKPENLRKRSTCLRSEGERNCDSKSFMHALQSSDTETFYRDRLDDMVGDVAVVCPLLDLADKRSEGGEGSVYFYHFVQRSSQNPWPEWMGVMHGYEIEFVFGLPLDESLKYTAHEQELSRNMMKLWANFARTGNPNSDKKTEGDVQKWEKYTKADRCINVIGTTSSAVNMTTLNSLEYSRLMTHCSFWNTFFPRIDSAHKKSGIQKNATDNNPNKTNPIKRGPPNSTERSNQLSFKLLVFSFSAFIFFSKYS